MDGGSSVELLSEIHRQERKDLQAKVQKLRHGIPKGDKKKKKSVTAEIALLEAELAAKHEWELSKLGQESSELNNIVKETAELKLQPNNVNSYSLPKPSKAQKRRDKKAVKEKERELEISQQELYNLTGARNIEYQKIKKILSERGLTVHEIPSDGDCLYKAVEHQLSTLGIQISVQELRQQTAAYMISHADDFIHFLTDPDSGDTMSGGQYHDYCNNIATTHVWGGHVEIQVLSHVCKMPIEVVQAEGPSVITGADDSKIKLILSYHRHIYGLGEHYNSVVQENKDQSADSL